MLTSCYFFLIYGAFIGRIFEDFFFCEENETNTVESSCIVCRGSNLTHVRPLFTLTHRRSDNSPLLIVFSVNYIDQSTVTFMRLKVG